VQRLRIPIAPIAASLIATPATAGVGLLDPGADFGTVRPPRTDSIGLSGDLPSDAVRAAEGVRASSGT
jgi:hypothetical protein